MDKQIIVSDQAPRAIGPYSAAIRFHHLVFTAGQLGIDPQTGELEQGLAAQASRALTNLKHVLEAAGSGLEYVLKTTVFLAEMSDFPELNAIYADFFGEKPPARSTVAVKTLPKNALVEIEAIAYVPEEGA